MNTEIEGEKDSSKLVENPKIRVISSVQVSSFTCINTS